LAQSDLLSLARQAPLLCYSAIFLGSTVGTLPASEEFHLLTERGVPLRDCGVRPDPVLVCDVICVLLL
jgi:hypothetical protein